MIQLTNSAPSAPEFNALRASCGWGTIATDTAALALATSIIVVTAYDNGKLIATGRVVGDGALYFYLQDIIVARSYRGKGYGRAIVNRLLADIAPLAKSGATIGLMSAKGVEPLYLAAGFTARPTERYGAGMTMVVD